MKLFSKTKDPFLHIVKRADMKKSQAYALRAVAVVISILVCSVASTIITGANYGKVLRDLFPGAFGSVNKLWGLGQEMALLLLVSLAVTPAFKMKFWNIGAEGQVHMGCIGCALAMHYFINLPGYPIMPMWLVYLLMLVFAVVFATIWSVIPAIFKAIWNTNETLFTLMMNYIASFLAAYLIAVFIADRGGKDSAIDFKLGWLPVVANQALIPILVAVVITAIMWAYLRYSKHGYELTVVGESERTAKYVGINVKKVIIRTMIFGGVICGITGFLLTGGLSHNLTETSAGGRGFTAILISWLAHFNPIAMVLTTFLVVFIQKGTGTIATNNNLSSSFADIMTGVFFFIIIASEFFISYRVVFRDGEKYKALFNRIFKKKVAVAEGADTTVVDNNTEEIDVVEEIEEEVQE